MDSVTAASTSSVGTEIGTELSTETSLNYLNGLLGHADGVMYVRDAVHNRFVLANPSFERLTGLSAAEIIGKTSHDLFPSFIADVHRANDLAVLADGVARTSREFATRADGSLREFISHKFPLFDRCGRAYAVGGISTDVTELEAERRATIRKQHESESRFRTVFEHAPIGQIFSEIQGPVTEVNAPLARMLGYQPEEMIGRSVADFADSDEMGRIKEAAASLMSGASITVSAIRRFRHRDGHLVPVRVTSALLRDDTGQPQWWASLVLDITEEERTRADLERVHRESLRAAERLQVLHTIAGAANEAADIETAAPQVLHAVGRHFGWLRGPAALGRR